MQTNQAPVSIRMTLDGIERTRVIEYVSDNMRKKHGSCPPPEKTPACLFAAFEGTQIVGTLGMLFGEKDIPLPIEEFFEFNHSTTPIPYVREQTVYYSRWNSSRPGIGAAVWLAASQYAERQGTIYTSLTIKDNMVDRYKAIGCMWHSIPDVRVRAENVGESERDYFFAKEGPRPWLGILKDQLLELPEIVRNLCTHRPITFDT